MSVNGISNQTPEYNAGTSAAGRTAAEQTVKTESTGTGKDNSQAAVYESSGNKSSSSASQIYKPDKSLVQRMKTEAEQRKLQMQNLVQKMMTDQGMTYNNSTDIFQVLKKGQLKISPEVSAQAKKDIAEDGYWGVKQTSDRLFSFATALSGGDPKKADEMMEAVKKGFNQATKSWGDKLPQICQDTLDATMERMKEWKNSLDTTGVEQG